MERLDRALDDIISEQRKGAKVKKKQKVTPVVKKRGRKGNKPSTTDLRSLLDRHKSGNTHKKPTKVSKYVDVDAPVDDAVQLSYGMETLPPTSRKRIGQRKNGSKGEHQ